MSRFKEVLIDGDLLIFACCAKAEYGHEPETVVVEEVFEAVQKKVEYIQADVDADLAVVYLSKGNFRNFVRSDYKSNRKDSWRPECLNEVRDLARFWLDAVEVEGLEADDLIVMNMGEGKVGATIDKDIPVTEDWYYKWDTIHSDAKLSKVSGLGYLEFKKSKASGNGLMFFLAQMLTGDSTDGIMGCGKKESYMVKSGKDAGQMKEKRKGVGAGAAVKLLSNITTYREGLGIVYGQYVERFGEVDALESMIQQGRLLWMVREIRTNELGHTEALMFHPNPSIFEWMDVITGELVDD